jgi:hypothetical protein
MSRARWYVALAGCLLGACDDGVLRAFEPRGPALAGGGSEAGSSAEAGGGGGGTTPILPVAGAGNAPPSSPLLIDDFEDGDLRAKEPIGWWYPVNDRTATQGFGIEPTSGGTASVYALRTHGSGFQAWGAAVGVNLVGDTVPLNALGYEQLCFAARVEADTGNLIEVHLLRDEVHYRQMVSLSETWTRYCSRLVDFISVDGAALVPSELTALQFFFPPGPPFVLWLDDVSVVP